MSPNYSQPSTRTDEPVEQLRPKSAQLTAQLNEFASVIGRKWNLVIVARLAHDGPLGFSELLDAIDDISSKVLTESLTRLDDYGLVERRIVSERPVRVEYSLTERGDAFEDLVAMVRNGDLRVE